MSRGAPADPLVRYLDEEPNGLATLVGGLLEANLRADPRRARLLRPAVIRIGAHDAGVWVRLVVDRSGVSLANASGQDPAPVQVVSDAGRLAELVAAPLRFGFPDPRRPEGRRVLAALARGEIRISGLVRHPLTISRLARLLSVA